METGILKSAKHFFAGTLLSRVMGMARDIAMAFCFGSSPEIAAFMVAYRLANLFRRLLGEGNLQSGFVPHFESLRAGDEKEAALFVRDVGATITMAVFGVVSAGWAVCWIIGGEIPALTALLMPGLFFICLYALNSALLQCQRRFFLPAFAPVAFNAVWIAAAWVLRNQESAVPGLCIGVIAAFAAQWLLTVRPVSRWMGENLSWRERFTPSFFSPRVRSLFKPVSFGIVGIGAAQINSALDAIFARLADPSGPAFLWYAIRVQQLPLALFGIALAGALLPPLSRAAPELSRYRELLQSALKQSAALTIPCAVGMVLLAPAGLDLLFGHGGFGSSDLHQTSLCLVAYAAGLMPMVYVLLLANGFYARKEFKQPMRASVLAVICNIVLNAMFVFALHWGAASIALATSISSWINYLFLMRKFGEPLQWKTGAVWICSGVGAALFFAVQICFSIEHEPSVLMQGFRFAALSSAYGIGVIGASYALKVREILSFFRRGSPT